MWLSYIKKGLKNIRKYNFNSDNQIKTFLSTFQKFSVLKKRYHTVLPHILKKNFDIMCWAHICILTSLS